MASVEIDIDDYLDEASTTFLASELQRRIKKGEKVNLEGVHIPEMDSDRLSEALACWRRGNVEDALFHLEFVLGRDWSGLSDILRRRAA